MTNRWMDKNQLVGFFSYKGGVGRTVALCNTALALLHQMRQRSGVSHGLLCVDFDLAAPGILPIFGLKQDNVNVFQPMLQGEIDRTTSIKDDCVELSLGDENPRLHVFAENEPDEYSISFMTEIFKEGGNRQKMDFIVEVLRERAREDFSAPITLVDLGAGFGFLPRYLFGMLDHLVLVARGDRQHRAIMPELLDGFRETYELERNPSVHVVLNQLPSAWLEPGNDELAEFLAESGIEKFMSEVEADRTDHQRTLEKIPLVDRALTHETVFFPEDWLVSDSTASPASQSRFIRQVETDSERMLRTAGRNIAASILDRVK